MADKVLPQPSTSDGIVLGKNVFLYINYGESATASVPVWALIGGQRSTSKQLTADSIDASHKTSGGWRVTKSGLRGWTFNADAVLILNDLGVEGVQKAFSEGKVAQFRLVTKDDDGDVVTAENGWGSVTNCSVDASYDDVATLSLEINGSGALTVESNPT